MTRGSHFRPAPHNVFVAAVAVFVAALLGSLLLASSAPWSGVEWVAPSPETPAWTVRTEPDSPASALFPSETTVLGVRTADGALIPAAEVHEALSRPAGVTPYHEYDQRLQLMDRLEHDLRRNRLSFVLDGGREVVLRSDSRRPPDLLGDRYWIRVACAAIAYLTAVGLWAFRPGTVVTRYFAGSGVALTAIMLTSAVAASREIGFPAELLRWLDHTTVLATVLFAGSAIGIISNYPKRLPVAGAMPLVFALFGLGLLAHLLRLTDTPLTALAGAIGSSMVYGLVLFAWQWRESRGHTRLRRGLAWFFLINAFVCLFYVGSYAVPVVLGQTPWLPAHYASLSATVLYLGAAFGVYRYSLFDLDPWIFSAWLWFIFGLLILVADAALLYLLDIDSGSSFAASLALVAWFWFPARQGLMLRLSRRIRRHDFRRLVADTLEAGFDAPSIRSAEARWRDLLQRCFAPLRIERTDSAPPQARLVAGGEVLALPQLAEAPAYAMTYADRGNRLFTPRDLELAQLLVALFEQASMARLAATRGARQERLRLARDLHDDVIPPILSYIYRSEGSPQAAEARRLLRELRQTVQALSLEDGAA